MLRCRAVLAAALIVAATACRLEPTGAAAWEPPAVYRAWFAKTEACSGLRGEYDRIDWFVVPGHSFPCDGGDCAAHWSSDHTIHIAEDWVASEMVVRHEMLHDLLGRAGHPDPPFGSPCPLTWETWPASGGSAVRADHPRID